MNTYCGVLFLSEMSQIYAKFVTKIDLYYYGIN